MNRFITYFLPENIEEADQNTQNKTTYLVFCLMGIFGACLATILIFAIYGIDKLVYFTLLMLSIATSLLFFLKKFNQIILTTFIFATFSATYIFTMIYYTGGINSPFIIWVMMLPFIGTFIAVTVRLIYYGIFLALAIYIFFLISGGQSVEIYNLISPDVAVTYRIINQIVAMVTAISILTFYYHQNAASNQQLKESYQQLKASNQQLEESNKNLEQFAYIASHDMKAPLRNIVSFSQLLKRKLSKTGSDDELEYLGFIERSGRKMNELIQGILDFSTVQTKTKIEKKAIDLNVLMNDITLNLKAEIEEQNAILDFSDLPTVQANELQIIQVFQNLISNGLKYNRSEKPTIKITYQTAPKHFVFLVEDNGIGMEKEYFDKIFEMFQRLNSGTEFTGTGIGLAICKKIALLHGGDLSVLKSSDLGSVFRFVLPL